MNFWRSPRKLQTIKALNELNCRNLSYEISIIYAIPGQTLRSFIETIEFCLTNKCKSIKAFPLQIAANSELAEKTHLYTTKQEHADTLVQSVHSSDSFDEQDRFFMNLLADRLDKKPYDNIYAGNIFDKEGLKKHEGFEYQYEISQDFIMKINNSLLQKLIYLINRYFVDALKKQECTEVNSIEFDPRKKHTDEQMQQFRVEVVEMLSRKYRCNDKILQCDVVIGESGNFYVIPQSVASQKEHC